MASQSLNIQAKEKSQQEKEFEEVQIAHLAKSSLDTLLKLLDICEPEDERLIEEAFSRKFGVHLQKNETSFSITPTKAYLFFMSGGIIGALILLITRMF